MTSRLVVRRLLSSSFAQLHSPDGLRLLTIASIVVFLTFRMWFVLLTVLVLNLNR